MIETGSDQAVVVNGDAPVGVLRLAQVEELLR
jgi:hypothetical protein